MCRHASVLGCRSTFGGFLSHKGTPIFAPILIGGFSIINHPFGGTPMTMEPSIWFPPTVVGLFYPWPTSESLRSQLVVRCSGESRIWWSTKQFFWGGIVPRSRSFSLFTIYRCFSQLWTSIYRGAEYLQTLLAGVQLLHLISAKCSYHQPHLTKWRRKSIWW